MVEHSYRLYLLNPKGNIVSRIELTRCDSDIWALERARQIAPDADLEVWDGDRFVQRVRALSPIRVDNV